MISEHFSREEFACRCGCGFDVVDKELLHVLEKVRTHFNAPVSINSACRCEQHNKDVGGADGSKHKLGIAADIVVRGVEQSMVYDYLCGYAVDKYGIGKYKSFTHIDVRKSKARWEI